MGDAMVPPTIAPIVEGHGETGALLPLIYNIVESNTGLVYPRIVRPYRAHWGSLVNRPEDLLRYAEIVLQEGGPGSSLLVLIDADGCCPAELGPKLFERLKLRFPDDPISVTVADWEYESWFIASSEAIAAHIGTDLSIDIPDRIEEIQNAKEWLELNILKRRYNETDDQAAFSSLIDVPLARQRSRSFDRFCLELNRLLSSSSLPCDKPL